MPERGPSLKTLAAAVRAYVAARNEAESLIPEQETDWPEGYDFAELTTANALEDQKWAELHKMLVAVERPKKPRKRAK